MTYPKTISDLFEEGRVLNHCVGSYGDAIKSGNSIVLFIRKKKEIDTPYFTLEVDPTHNAVTQIGGYSDVIMEVNADNDFGLLGISMSNLL